MDSHLETIVAAWNESRTMTMELSNNLTQAQLRKKQSRPGLNSIGMHLLEMADVTSAYAESISTGKLSFSRVKDSYADDLQTPDRVSAVLTKSSEAIEKAVKAAPTDLTINAFGEDLSLEEMLITLVRHENMHHGQIIAFSYASSIPMPQSWHDNWALPMDE